MRTIVLRPSRRTDTRPTSRSTCRCFETDGCPISRASTISPTVRSSPARNSRMCRRRGSAMALNGSDVVEARATPLLYIPISEYVKTGLRRPAHLAHQVQDLARRVDAADGHLLIERAAHELLHRRAVECIEPGRPEERARAVDGAFDVGFQRDVLQHATRIDGMPEEHDVVLPARVGRPRAIDGVHEPGDLGLAPHDRLALESVLLLEHPIDRTLDRPHVALRGSKQDVAAVDVGADVLQAELLEARLQRPHRHGVLSADVDAAQQRDVGRARAHGVRTAARPTTRIHVTRPSSSRTNSIDWPRSGPSVTTR